MNNDNFSPLKLFSAMTNDQPDLERGQVLFDYEKLNGVVTFEGNQYHVAIKPIYKKESEQ